MPFFNFFFWLILLAFSFLFLAVYLRYHHIFTLFNILLVFFYFLSCYIFFHFFSISPFFSSLILLRCCSLCLFSLFLLIHFRSAIFFSNISFSRFHFFFFSCSFSFSFSLFLYSSLAFLSFIICYFIFPFIFLSLSSISIIIFSNLLVHTSPSIT